jgi:predicted ATPase/DNA-binding winged helix-turn-helix (wHTH) protein
MTRPAAQTREVLSFGPFRLVVSERLLTKGGVPVELGARALDALITLVSHPNEIISKKDLLARVWPDVTVEEGSLRVQIASLRKILGDGRNGARYIATMAGRGYSFLAPILRSDDPGNAYMADRSSIRYANLPNSLSRMLGRSDDTRLISTELRTTRFVTIVGAGGVGKTTVAIAVANDLMEAFAGAVLFVDLGMLNDPNLAATAIASMLGLPIQTGDVASSLIAYLHDNRILLILDTCEHLIETVAALAARIFAAGPQVHILATSREALRVEGEHVYNLEPLACPPDDPRLTAATTKTFPAAQLFLERAVTGGVRLDFNDAEAAIVARICRKLDGVALAIELAAGRVAAYGLPQTAALLDQHLALLWQGQRTAPARQKTLLATLDWSYGLLSDLERVVFRRLAVFVGHFTLEAALAVVACASVDQSLVFRAIDSLIAKSIVATRPIGAMMRYRLLDATRAYALNISIDGVALADLAERHAAYYRRWLEQAEIELQTHSGTVERMPYFSGLNNVRAALEWCFGVYGNAEAGVELASAATPVFLRMSLLPECHRWSERALRSLPKGKLGQPEEMHLQAAFGMSVMFARGQSEAVLAALNRSLSIAEEHADALNQLRFLGMLQQFCLRSGDFKAALHYANRCSAVSSKTEDPAVVALAQSLLGISLQLAGRLSQARVELETAIRHRSGSRTTSKIYLGFHYQSWASIHLATTLWLQGHPAQAMDIARQTLKSPECMDHPVTLSGTLNRAISIFLWAGDLESTQQHVEWLISHAQSHYLVPWLSVARGIKGQLAIRWGDAKSGVEGLKECLDELHAEGNDLVSTEFKISLVQGLAAIGRFDEAMTLINETIRFVEVNGDLCYMPELLRVKGGVLVSTLMPSMDDAEMCFVQALELSRCQGAKSWELRTGIDLAALLVTRGQPEGARVLLQPIFGQFVEGFDTADLVAAERILATLD